MGTIVLAHGDHNKVLQLGLCGLCHWGVTFRPGWGVVLSWGLYGVSVTGPVRESLNVQSSGTTIWREHFWWSEDCWDNAC